VRTSIEIVNSEPGRIPGWSDDQGNWSWSVGPNREMSAANVNRVSKTDHAKTDQALHAWQKRGSGMIKGDAQRAASSSL
jgi:hypothetical protein